MMIKISNSSLIHFHIYLFITGYTTSIIYFLVNPYDDCEYIRFRDSLKIPTLIVQINKYIYIVEIKK